MAEQSKQLYQKIKQLLDKSQRDELKIVFADMWESEIAEVVELLDDDEQKIVFDLLDLETAAEVLEKVNEATRSDLFEILEDEKLKNIISELDPEDAADVLAEMEEEDSAEVLEQMEPEESAQIREIMKYSEDSAGGIMDLDVISITENQTVSEAVEKIRQADIDEDFYSVFVVNSQEQFLGIVRIRHLITARADTQIKQFVDTDTIYVNVDTDQEEIRNIFSKNDLIVVPVIDENNILVGRITADRVIEVAEEEAAEDIYTMAGTDADELDDPSIIRAARIRMTWLLPCLLGTGFTAIVVLFFKGLYNTDQVLYIYTIAMAFVPMIAAISGNAGLQTSAIVVSGLAAGHLVDLRISKVFAREVRVAFFVAIMCGIVGGVICGALSNIIDSSETVVKGIELLRVSSAFTVAMFASIMVATTLGLFLPFAFKKVGIDPAISSGPLVTTANDSISVAIYLTLTLILI